jgi:hypothetical protein
MKVLLSIFSIFMFSTIGLGPGIAGGAQLLSDDDLDQVTAAGGTTWSVDILPTNLVLGTTPTTSQVQTTPALSSAFATVSAAAASAEAARAVSGIAGLAVASSAVSTAATALETASFANGIDSLNAGKATLSAAADLINSIPITQHTPELVKAANQVNQAAFSLNQSALDSKAIELNSAVKAVEAAKNAINALPVIGGDAGDHSPAINAAVKSIQVAKEAIDAASKVQVVSGGGSQTTFVLKENGNGSLDPVLRINFNSGRTVGSADIIPLLPRGAPGQPALNLDGATIAGPNGLLPLQLIAETLMMNINLCYACVADKIIQNNNGYIVPIYAQ